MSGPVVAVDLGVTGVAVSVDVAGARDGPPVPSVDDVEPVDVGGAEGPVELAAVHAPSDGSQLVTGHEARRRAAADPSRYEPTPRRRIDEGELLLGTRLVGVGEALGVVLAAALDRVGPLLRGERPRLLVLTHPAGWAAGRRDVLRRAGSGLGDAVVLLPEPLAVAAHARWMRPRGARPGDGPVAVLDVGATAVTASVVGPGPDGAPLVLADRGDDGPDSGAGDHADELLLAHLLAGLRADDPTAARVHEVAAGATLADRRHRQVLVDDVRAARERLSDAEQAPVPLPGRETAAWCSRGELEDVLRPALRRAVALLAETVAAAGLEPAALEGVHLVGGGARTPLLGTLVHRELGIPATVAPEPRSVVARGALVVARERTGGRRAGAAGASVPPTPARSHALDAVTSAARPHGLDAVASARPRGDGAPAPARGPDPLREPSASAAGRSAPASWAGDRPRTPPRGMGTVPSAGPAPRATGPARSRPSRSGVPRPADDTDPGEEPLYRPSAAASVLPDWPDPLDDVPTDPHLPAVTPPARPRRWRRPRLPVRRPTAAREGGRGRLAVAAAGAALLVAVGGSLLAGGGTDAAEPPAVTEFSHSYPLPSGWAPAGVDPVARRSQVRPADAPRGPDLVAVQEEPLAGDESTARARIAERYAAAVASGGVSGLDLQTTYAGRRVVHYVQVPAAGTRVDWYVVFDGGLQLSVGCRRDGAGAAVVEAACAQVVAGLRART